MEPLTTALLATITTAAGAIAGGIAEAVGDDVWAAAKAKLAAWAGLDKRRKMAAAFDQAVRDAVAELRRSADRRPEWVERALGLLTDDSPEGRSFRAVAVEELLFRHTPDLGRVLDEYRRNLRFAALLRREQPPHWNEVQPVLQMLFQAFLPAELLKDDNLREIVLDRAELDALAAARATAASTADSAASLRRIEALLQDMNDLPRIQAGIQAVDGASVRNAPITIVLGNQTTYSLPATPPPDLDALFRSYHDFIAKTYATLDFRGIAQVQNVVRLRLEEVYVPLRGSVAGSSANDPASRRVYDPHVGRLVDLKTGGRLALPDDLRELDAIHMAGHGDIAVGDAAGRDVQKTALLETLVRDAPFLVILGDPGTGKSTLVKVIMLALAKGRAGAEIGLSDEWLPIFFPVAAFAEARGDPGRRDLAPLDYLRDYFAGRNQPDYTPLFERALLAGRALLLFDGLDEVREDRLAVVRCLEDFIRAWDAPGNRFLATSRIAGYEDAPLDPGLFARATIAPFDDEQIRAFAGRWSRAFERAGQSGDAGADPLLEQRAAERAADLEQAIFGSGYIADLARNPLLLTILAIIHNQGARLPDRRVDLYRLCVEALAETWNRARSLSGREIDVYLGEEKLDERFVVNLLGPAALRIHAENPGGIVEEQDLERWLAETLAETDGLPRGRAGRLAQDFIGLVNRETGLLQERGHRRYSFLHLTFEEYLAARGLLESATLDDPDAEIRRRAVDSGWREVLRLAIASATQREASRLLLLLLEAPTDPQTRGRPVVLAGECLLDIGRNGATQRAWRGVITALLNLLRRGETPIATRVEAGHVLGRLGDPRRLNPKTGNAFGIDEYNLVEPYWCKVDAGPFWFGDERIKEEDDEDDEAEEAEEAGDAADGDEEEVTNEEPRPPRFDPAQLQRAELPYAFKIGRYPVSNAEFAAFLEANGPDGYDPDAPWWTEEGRTFLAPGGHRFDNQEEYVRLPRFWNAQDYNSPAQPVVGVSWYEATAYCRWLTDIGHKRGWLPSDREIRLPTSLEWERAARHTDRRPYPWVDAAPDPERANYAAADVGAPSPAGCFPAGRAVCGAEDLIGNVLEWLSTAYADDQSVTAIAPQKDFTPNEIALLSYTWFHDSTDELCSGARSGSDPLDGYNDGGFRVIQSLRAHR